MADREYPWNISDLFFIPSTVDKNRAYPLTPGAKTISASASPLVGRLIDQPPLVKAEAMRADPDAYYAQVRAERDEGAGGDAVSEGEAQDAELDLVMPFVTVASNGGPHDDPSYAAGYEMGLLDALLEHGQPPVYDQPIHAENAAQADLIAMRHGYHSRIEETGDTAWRHLWLTRIDLADGVVV